VRCRQTIVDHISTGLHEGQWGHHDVLISNAFDVCHLMPGMRNSTITNRLRSAKQFPLIFAKTNKFNNSFIPTDISITLAETCMTFLELFAFHVCYNLYVVLYLIQPLAAILLYCNMCCIVTLWHKQRRYNCTMRLVALCKWIWNDNNITTSKRQTDKEARPFFRLFDCPLFQLESK